MRIPKSVSCSNSHRLMRGEREKEIKKSKAPVTILCPPSPPPTLGNSMQVQ